MSKFMRWATLALFCAAFGFGGSVGGIALMQDDLRGERGETGAPGPTGATGSQGPPGQTGPAGPAANTVGLSFDLDQLDRRIDDLESGGRRACTFLTRLVTGVSLSDFLGRLTLDVDETPFLVCVNPGP